MKKLPKAPVGEGVDPLTDGNSYHGEDIKGNSTLNQEVAKPVAKTKRVSGVAKVRAAVKKAVKRS